MISVISLILERAIQMPKLSIDTIVQRAIEPATLDRRSLAECYGDAAPERGQLMADAKSFSVLRGKKLANLGLDERKLAFQALVYAEQWNISIADAQHRTGHVAREALRHARQYRQARLAEFGQTQLEAIYHPRSAAVDRSDSSMPSSGHISS